jgi:xanthine dehydrogenase small subunit
LQEEISPISDVRGSSEYKRLLLRQLFFCHFLKLFPDRIPAIELLQKI